MIDGMSEEPHVHLGFSVFLVLLTLAWNIDWRHYIRYWDFFRGQFPSLRPWWEIGIRCFFVIGFLGSVEGLISIIYQNHFTSSDWGYSLLDSVFLCAVAFLFFDGPARWWLGRPNNPA